jgi:hypothetical protein
MLLLTAFQPISKEDLAHLPNLIDLGLASFTLEVDQLSHSLLSENVVAATSPPLKSQPLQQPDQFVECDIRVRLTLQYPTPKFLVLTHLPSKAIVPH